MTFVGRTVWEVHQGREGDFIGFCRRGAEIHKRLGAANVALIAHNGVTLQKKPSLLTFAEGARYGTFVDALPSDSEWLTMGQEFVADPPARIVSQDTGTNLLS